MAQFTCIRAEFWQGSDVRVMARILKPDGAVLTTADCGLRGVVLTLHDMSAADPTAVVFGVTNGFTSGFVFPLGTVAGWTNDSIGANFLFVLTDANYFAQTPAVGGHKYRVEVRIRTTSFGDIKFPIELSCKSLLGA
jgi:hypothetical protein